MTDYAADLETAVTRVTERLRRVTDAAAAHRPAPGKWSAKEVVGHLIDSASHNHQRFVWAQWLEDLVFVGYRQDEWVASQKYQEAPWGELLDLWLAFNRHITRVMRAIPTTVRQREHLRRNLDEVAWSPLPEGVPATLDHVMADYAAHLHHHLRQVEAMGGLGAE